METSRRKSNKIYERVDQLGKMPRKSEVQGAPKKPLTWSCITANDLRINTLCPTHLKSAPLDNDHALQLSATSCYFSTY